MNRTSTHRTNGAIGALLDEYEKALSELKDAIESLSKSQLTEVVDPNAEDEDCRSIQTVLTHVVQSGYTYTVEIRKWIGEDCDYRDKATLFSSGEYASALNKMFQFNEQLFADHPGINLTENDADKKIKVRWGQTYDVEQLMEHAIVHVLRHRRQIDVFKRKIKSNS